VAKRRAIKQPAKQEQEAAAPRRRATRARAVDRQPPEAAEDFDDDSVRARILRTAEAMFAEYGMAGVGLRAITSAANVNLASVAYHFGSKDGLLEELFALRAAPIAEERMRLLSECEEKAGGAPALEDILDAFLRPALTLGMEKRLGGPAFVRLRARLATEPEKIARKILSKAFDLSSKRFIEAVAKALPDIPHAQVEWRFHFMLGAMVYTMGNSGRIQALTGGRCDPGDLKQALRYMVPFLAAGFRSPPLSRS